MEIQRDQERKKAKKVKKKSAQQMQALWEAEEERGREMEREAWRIGQELRQELDAPVQHRCYVAGLRCMSMILARWGHLHATRAVHTWYNETQKQ